MTEQQWFSCTDPQAMLRFITENPDHANINCYRGDRKLRLFACACCKAIWDGLPCPRNCYPTTATYIAGPRSFRNEEGLEYLCDCEDGKVGGLTDPRSRRAVEVAELYADGGYSDVELLAAIGQAITARSEAGFTPFDPGHDQAKDMLLLAAANCCQPPASGAAAEVSRLIQNQLPYAAQAGLLRDIFGNPFHVYILRGDAVQKWDDILRWNDRTIPRIAQAIYDERRWGDMPILGDALIDSGCDDQALIDHCQQPGAHVRGCWILDLLLCKG